MFDNACHSDILYLNKQRLKALEELDKMKREKVNKQASTGKGDGHLNMLFMYS